MTRVVPVMGTVLEYGIEFFYFFWETLGCSYRTGLSKIQGKVGGVSYMCDCIYRVTGIVVVGEGGDGGLGYAG